jgi:hypothetical protein
VFLEVYGWLLCIVIEGSVSATLSAGALVF